MQGYVQIENRNMYREGFFKILRTNFGSGLGSRLPLLAILLLQNIGNANFCKARNGMSSEEGRGGKEKDKEIPGYLKDVLEALAVWPKALNSTRGDEGENTSGGVFTALSSLLNAITCSDNDEENIDELAQCDEETGNFDPDLLSIRRLLLMSSEVPLTHNERMSGVDNVWSPLVYSLCSLLVEHTKSSLVSLQATANCLYSLARVCFTETPVDPQRSIAGVDDIVRKDRFCFTATRHAVKLAADAISKRIEGSNGDIVMSSFQEELRRTFGLKWSEVSVKLMTDCVILLPPVQSVNLRIGLEFGMPISQVEATRRDVQVFLLMRALYKQIYRILSKNDGSESSIDDVCLKMMDENICKLSEFGCLDPQYSEFKQISLSDKVSFPVVMSSSASSSGERKTISTPERPAKRIADTTAAMLATPTSPAIVPVGHIQGQVSVIMEDADDKWLENLHVVFNDYAFIVVSRDPKDISTGTIRLICPIHQTDVSISTERRNILKVLVRCSDQLPLMERIGVTNDNPETMGTGVYGRKGTSSFSMNSQGAQRGISLLQQRQPNVLWRASMWFDNEKDCEVTSQHIELRRIQVRQEKLMKLQEVLEFWSDSKNVIPYDEHKGEED